MNFIQPSTIKSVQPTFARVFLSLTAVLILVLTPICTMAQNEGEAAPGVTKMFSSDSPIAVTINAPWNSIVKDKKNQDAYPATIEFPALRAMCKAWHLQMGKPRQSVSPAKNWRLTA